MSTLDSSTMRREHNRADYDHLMWLEDIGRWRTEHRRATASLTQARAALADAEAALESHAEAVQAHQSRVRHHAKVITARERASRDFEPDELLKQREELSAAGEIDYDALEQTHRELQKTHEQARKAHQRIREHHFHVTEEIARLLAKLNAPM